MLFGLQYIELIIRFTLARIFVTKRAAYLAVYGIRLSTGGLLLVSFFSEQNLNVESVSARNRLLNLLSSEQHAHGCI